MAMHTREVRKKKGARHNKKRSRSVSLSTTNGTEYQRHNQSKQKNCKQSNRKTLSGHSRPQAPQLFEQVITCQKQNVRGPAEGVVELTESTACIGRRGLLGVRKCNRCRKTRHAQVCWLLVAGFSGWGSVVMQPHPQEAPLFNTLLQAACHAGLRFIWTSGLLAESSGGPHCHPRILGCIMQGSFASGCARGPFARGIKASNESFCAESLM